MENPAAASDPAKNFGLSPEEFLRLCKNLENGDENLVEVIFKSHFEACRKFLSRKMGATSDVAYDLTKDTLLKFRKNLLAGKIRYGNLAALFTLDARNSFLKWQSKMGKNPSVPLDESFHNIADEPENEGPYDLELLNRLKNALKNLGTDCFELINWHYYLDLSQRLIAEKRIGRGDSKFINEDSVKTKLAECRKKIKNLL